jgi:hypothetical protein
MSRFLPWLGAVVLAAGIIVLVVKLTDNGSTQLVRYPPPQELRGASGFPGTPIHSMKQVPASAKQSLTQWVLSAPARKNMALSWKLTAKNFNGEARPSLKQWKTGNIPVQVYPPASWAWDFKHNSKLLPGSTNQEMTIDVGMDAQPAARIKPATFRFGVHRRGPGAHPRWVVDYFNSVWNPKIPTQ